MIHPYPMHCQKNILLNGTKSSTRSAVFWVNLEILQFTQTTELDQVNWCGHCSYTSYNLQLL